MLTLLTVNNFAIAEHVDISFDTGMTVITGETGAGKSIVLDALGLTLGDRADAGVVRYGEDRADISATFDVSKLTDAKSWLKEHDLDMGDDCILRRVITKEGRSRGYINGQPNPLQNLRQLGEMLIDIHSQHEHQSLLRKDTHVALLDNFSDLNALGKEVRHLYKLWSEHAKKLEQLQNSDDEREARIQLLTYQQQELDNLSLEAGEITRLEVEQSKLANAEELLKGGHHAIQLCSEEDTNIESMLTQAIQQLESHIEASEAFAESHQMLSDALIQVQEATGNIRNFVDGFELDPQRLQEVEDRLSQAYQLARKHKVSPEELLEVAKNISTELSQYDCSASSLEALEATVSESAALFTAKATQLSDLRKKSATLLDKEIKAQLAHLNMTSVNFVTQFTPLEKFDIRGLESIEFLVSTNPGQPPKPLAKVASGGELSRISLAIQVILANTSTIPTLVFDEVDVGIGGSTAEIVGQMLRNLGSRGQVFCVTHLPQVASSGHQHLHVNKQAENGSTFSQIYNLDSGQRVNEIARMLGGIDITEKSLAHAKEMLEAI